MTHTTTDAAEARALTVIQEDRDSAARVAEQFKDAFAADGFNERFPLRIREGVWDEHWLVEAFASHRLATAEAASGAGERGTGKPDYEPAWREMYDALSWMHGCKPLAGYAGWPLGKIATDLIDQAYPGLREGTAPTAEGLVTKMREAICGVADDYQTSEQHHPGHVLIPRARFEQLRAVAEELEATHD